MSATDPRSRGTGRDSTHVGASQGDAKTCGGGGLEATDTPAGGEQPGTAETRRVSQAHRDLGKSGRSRSGPRK